MLTVAPRHWKQLVLVQVLLHVTPRLVLILMLTVAPWHWKPACARSGAVSELMPMYHPFPSLYNLLLCALVSLHTFISPSTYV